MTAKHELMQRVIGRLPVWSEALPEQLIDVPTHPVRTRLRRRIDVAVKMPTASKHCLLSVECQHSGTNLRREEQRVLDHNLAGLPVLLVVSSDCVRASSPGTARVDFWVREWAKRHGRQQVAVIDDDGDLWWCWFDPQDGSLDVPTRRTLIHPGSLSPDNKWQLGITVASTSPTSSTGAPSLLIAAFSWISASQADATSNAWPSQTVTPRKSFQPDLLPKASYLGSKAGKDRFLANAVVSGGF
jgi:hypothetical protein